MKSVFLQPTVIVASLFILVLVGGGVYGGIRIYSNARDKDALVERAVTEYSSKKEMAQDMKVMMVRELKKRWSKLEKDLRKK